MEGEASPGAGGASPLPLAGVGVVVTRAEDDQGPLTALLRARGARVLHWGSLTFGPPEDPAPLLAALERLQAFDWVYFSSPRAVDAVLDRVGEAPPGVRIAAVGPSTAAALQERGWPVHRVPAGGSGEAVVEAFREAGDAPGARILFPASAMAREVVPRGLEELGAVVHQVTAYRTLTLPLDRERCRRAVEGGEVQVVAFASPSAMAALREGVGPGLFGRLAREAGGAAMGATTAGALAEAGWRRVAVAPWPTLEGLAEAAVGAASGPKAGGAAAERAGGP